LRRLKLFSVKCGCCQGLCASCTVLIGDRAVSSCLIPVASVRNQQIITLEYFKQTESYTDIIKGFEKASMRSIAAMTGITAGALYKHFPSKAAIFEALVPPQLRGVDVAVFTVGSLGCEALSLNLGQLEDDDGGLCPPWPGR